MLLSLFSVAGRRTLGEISTFDFALVLVISEAVQQAMVGSDFSITNALLIVLTLITLDVVLAYAKRRFRTLDRVVDGVPLVLVERGRPLRERMRAARVDEDDVLAAARLGPGLERMEQIRYAVLERDGKISVIPHRGQMDDPADAPSEAGR